MRKWKTILSSGLVLLVICSTPSFALAEQTPSSPDVNKALHRPYTVATDIVDSNFHTDEVNSFLDDGTKLTDGIIGPNTWTAHGPWVGYERQNRHDVVVDLGDVQTLHKLDAWFLQDINSGIWYPMRVTFSVSKNGNTWKDVGVATTATPLSDSNITVQQFAIDNTNVSGRYVRYTFYTNVWVFLSEVEAWGQTENKAINPSQENDTDLQKNQENDTDLQKNSFNPDAYNNKGFPLAGSKEAGGRKHQVLIYSGYYRPNSPLTWNVTQFLPYVSYVDQSQSIKDYMFDSFLFLQEGPAPSGGQYGASANQSTQSDWQNYADSLFQKDQQLYALDQAVDQVKNSLSDPNHKVKVTISIPFPGIGSNWGNGLDFNPNNVGQDLSLVNRVKAVKWYIDYIHQKWNQAEFKNLSFEGFYWYEENVKYAFTPNEENLIKAVSALVHQNEGEKFDWIPFVQSEGFRHWKQLGFDTALMQPNYAWSGGLDRFQTTDYLANHYGLGEEIELGYNIFSKQTRDNYKQYLDAAYQYKYQNSFLAWYQNYQDLLVASQSSNPDVRQVYDETYQFIKGTYQP